MRCHNYIFFQSNPLFHDLNNVLQEEFKKEFLEELIQEKNVVTNTYATLGLKTNMNMLLWFQAETIDSIQLFLNRLMHTKLGTYLTITHTLFGMIRPTQYSSSSVTHIDTNRKGGKYLVIYPFTKTQDWYLLDFGVRKDLMDGHISVGRKYPQITQLLLYSYGIDDSEFIVSYETDDLSEFQKLVMDLRSDKVRAYTKKDVPIFTCIYKAQENILDFL